MRSLVGLGLLCFTCGCAANASVSVGMSAGEAAASQASEAAGEPDEAPARRALADRTGNPWADCYRAFQPVDDAAVDLEHLTHACGAALKLAPLTPIHAGSQREQGKSERLAVSMRRGRCYRAFAVGQRDIVDLDLAIFDPSGGLVAADLSHDRWSVAPPRGPLCPARSGRYVLDVAVTEGAGEYLVQVWGTAEEPPVDDEATPSSE
ncbi:MAG: hypothetical protein ABJE95_13815 [Byssovorax sp.]